MGRKGERGRRESVLRLTDDLLRISASSGTVDWSRHESARQITEQLQKLQQPAKCNSRDAALPAFISWINQTGPRLNGIEICEFPEFGYGLKATKSFNEGENILNVPRKLIMTEDAAKKSVLGAFIEKDPILKFMPNITLVMYLLMEKFNPDSFWKPYIDILPSSYNTILYFSSEDLLELKGSPNFQAALKFYNDISRQYAYFYKKLQSSDDPAALLLKNIFTFEEYRWAVSTVMTRVNIVPSEIDGVTQTTALIPLWDICNHTNGEITTNYNVDQNQAEFFSLKNYKEGEQILIFYGVRTNAFFFLYNGFVYPENEHDALVINLGISANDPLGALKKQTLQKVNIDANTNFKILSANPPLSEELVAFSRVFVMDKEQLEFMCNNDTDGLKSIGNTSIDASVEKKAYGFINVRCKLLLNTYTKDLKNGLDSLVISDGAKRNQVHRSLVKSLKETEMKLLNRAIEFTQGKL